MVGVAGRSKGCNTCKKRRIACSLERPHCAKCIKSNRICGGYQRERIFIFHSDSAGDVSKSDKRKTSYEQDSRPRSQASSPDANDRPQLASLSNQKAKTLTLQSQPRSIVSPISLYRQQIFGEFMSQYMPVHRAGGFRRDEPGFISLFGEMAEPHAALEAAVLAVCTAKLSRWRTDPCLARESLKLYGRALRELQHALWDPTSISGDEILAASMALLLYESMECPEKSVDGWISHLNGCGRLIRIRGPEAHSTPLAHQVFLAYRLNEIHVAVRSHRSTFLSDAEWIDGPWKNRTKTPLDRVMDIAALLSKIFSEAMEKPKVGEPQKICSILLGFVERCWQLDRELHNLFEDYGNENLGPLFWPAFTKQSEMDKIGEEEILFPVVFQFSNLRTAQTCMLYWAVSAFVVTVISVLYLHIRTLQLVDVTNNRQSEDAASESNGSNVNVEDEVELFAAELPQLQERHNVLDLCRKICQSVEYCTQGEMKEIGQMMTIIPLVSVIDILSQHPNGNREVQWAIKMIESFKSTVRVMEYAMDP